MTTLVLSLCVMASWVAMFGLLYPLMGVAAIIFPVAHIALLFLGPEYEGFMRSKASGNAV
ncbi:MAG: hypothetical protein HONBIEJF_02699 [Fimbriimonadaceae bacterium]|nr:hypothetical protein [Fimbriimonadaceae bacterium]